ncbi:MAG TPA: divalent metal cation transporter [Steroidobacteraceae bacterium]|nr:divalent metal cation transporter [Steroidobacteraceae bacterium]
MTRRRKTPRRSRPNTHSSAPAGPGKPTWRQILGPGLITGASDDDPSGIATYSQAGARYGYQLAWTLLITYPLMSAVQAISARIGRTTGRGIAGNLRKHYPRPLLEFIVVLLFAANTLNIGADLGAMAAASRLLVPAVPAWLYIVLFGMICVLGQVFIKHRRYVAVLRWVTLSLFAYFAALLMVHVQWSELARGLLWPRLALDREFWMLVVAVLGTTISPYLFFWQAGQEVEDTKAIRERQPLHREPRQGANALARIHLDTLIGMGFSNLVALAILVTAAATLQKAGGQEIQSAAQAAEALRPVAGNFAFAVFALGIIGTGLLAVPVLAGSAAYALGEARGWPVGLARAPLQAKAFYGAIAVATLLGALSNFLSIDPMIALVWVAVINGVVALPVMVVMMLMARNRHIMGAFRISGLLHTLGWIATAVMGLATLAFILSITHAL